jgi:hypothetical protein
LDHSHGWQRSGDACLIEGFFGGLVEGAMAPSRAAANFIPFSETQLVAVASISCTVVRFSRAEDARGVFGIGIRDGF